MKKPSPSHHQSITVCIFCQKCKVNDDAIGGGEQGLAAVTIAMNSRKEFRSTKDMEVLLLDRVDEALGRSNAAILWHRTCYGQYTEKNEVEHLKKAHQGRSTRSTNCKNSDVDDKRKPVV